MRLVWQWVQLERIAAAGLDGVPRRAHHGSARRRRPRGSAARRRRTRCAAATSCACSSSRTGSVRAGGAPARAAPPRPRRDIGGHARARAASPRPSPWPPAEARDARRRSGTRRRSQTLPPDWSRHARRGRAAVERPPRARRAPDGARQPATRSATALVACASASRAGSATACRRAWCAAASRGSTRRRSRGELEHPPRVSPTRDTVATQGPVWRVGGRVGLSARPGQLDGDRAGLGRRRLGRRRRRARSTRCSATRSADIFNGLKVLTGTLGTPTYVPAERGRRDRRGPRAARR